MSLVLYPRAAPSDCLRVWVGVFQATQTPALNWSLDDSPITPVALREISSVRPDDLLPADIPPAQVPRAFTGVYEFNNLQADTSYAITASAGGESVKLETFTLPASVPTQLDRSFNVLLISCFHQAEDRGGLAGKIVSQFRGPAQPHLTVLAGDQVYLDLPTLKDFPDDPAWLADMSEKDYTVNWRGPLAYTQVLAAAPSISIPDDHENWNNYPHPSPFIANSRTATSRENWRRAAQAVYEGFQLPYPIKLGDSTTIEVEPLSFFFADTRT